MKTLHRLFLRGLLCSILLGIAQFSLIAQQKPYKANLSDAEKIYGLSLFWQEVNYNFAFFHQIPHLNWDSTYKAFIPKVLATYSTEDYYRVLAKMGALLKDGHTSIRFPREVYQTYSNLKIRLKAIQKRAFVTNVDQLLSKQIPIGSELLKVNGQPLKKYLKAQILPYIFASTEHDLWNKGISRMFFGKRGDKFQLTFGTPQGKISQITLRRDRKGVKWVKQIQKKPLISFKWLSQKMAYLKLDNFMNNQIKADFLKVLPELYKAKGIVIDVRDNPGGNGKNAVFIVKHFTEQKKLKGAKTHSRIHSSSLKAWGSWFEYSLDQNPQMKLNPEQRENFKYYQGKAWKTDLNVNKNDLKVKKISVPLVVLTNHYTGSAAEDFLIYLSNLKRATRVGQLTNGSTGQPLLVWLPGGGNAVICAKRDTYPNGKDFVGVGVKPHIEVNPSVEDFVKNNDVILKKGVEVLKEKIKNSK
ncbi:hypothetical protein BKI52_07585 [marine bacterium AO1-C]|nr:hypothetical protein BKI52_07585 [marine bacterium AO1-C]